MGVLTLTVLGGFLAMDETSVGQFMVSRPLVAGTLTGMLVGDPTAGLALGSILELFYLAHFHVGGARFPESVPAAITAVAVAAAAPGPGGLALGLVGGLGLGEIGGRSIAWLRHVSMRIVPDPSEAPVHDGEVVRAHVAALLLDLVRGATVTLLGVALLPPVARLVAPEWPLGPEVTLGLLLAVATVPLGVLWRGLSGRRRRRTVFAVGLVVGLAAGWVL